MADQGPPKLTPDTPMAPDTGESNVAINRRSSEDERSSNLAGMDIYPNRVIAKELYLEESLRVGSGVTITDGSITTDMLAADAVTAAKIDVDTLSAITADMGTLTAGTISGGSINVSSGGVTVSNDGGTDGIYMGANTFYTKHDGAKTFEIVGSTGAVTIGSGASVGGATASALTQTFYQSSAPTAVHTGDLWVDSDDLKMYRWNGADWTTQNVANLNTTFAQDAIPTSLAAGDLWIDTNDGNKMYRAASVGADEVKAGEWVAVIDAINAGGYVTVDANNNITDISTAGITVGTATSGARVQMTSTGVKVYDSADVARTQMTANGFGIRNSTGGYSPNEWEEISFIDPDTDHIDGHIFMDHTDTGVTPHSLMIVSLDNGDTPAVVSDIVLSASGKLFIGSGVGGAEIYCPDSDLEVAVVDGDMTVSLNTGHAVDVTGNVWATNLSETATTWSPTFTCAGTMTYTAASPAATGTKANHWHIGPFVFFSLHQGFTLGPTGDPSDEIYFTLPHNVASNDFHAMSGSHFNGTIDQATNVIYHSTSQLKVMKVDESDFTEAAGQTLTIQGWYVPA